MYDNLKKFILALAKHEKNLMKECRKSGGKAKKVAEELGVTLSDAEWKVLETGDEAALRKALGKDFSALMVFWPDGVVSEGDEDPKG